MLRVFGIPNCDTVKKARRFLDKNNLDYEFCDFKKQAPTLDQLKDWESQLGDELVNKRGRTFRQIQEDYQNLNLEKRLRLLQTHTSAIKRPLIVRDEKVLITGFDESSYIEKLRLSK